MFTCKLFKNSLEIATNTRSNIICIINAFSKFKVQVTSGTAITSVSYMSKVYEIRVRKTRNEFADHLHIRFGIAEQFVCSANPIGWIKHFVFFVPEICSANSS
eukprot:488839_1